MSNLHRANSLLLPDGSHHSLQEKDVVPLNREEIVLMSKLQEFAAKHHINIFCKGCEQPVRGQNNGSSTYLSVQCQCREFRYTGG